PSWPTWRVEISARASEARRRGADEPGGPLRYLVDRVATLVGAVGEEAECSGGAGKSCGNLEVCCSEGRLAALACKGSGEDHRIIGERSGDRRLRSKALTIAALEDVEARLIH